VNLAHDYRERVSPNGGTTTVPTAIDAVIYVPTALLSTDAYTDALARCHAYCTRCGYTVIGIARTWEEVEEAYARRDIGVLVVDRHDHLDPNREPRIEVVAATEHVAVDPLARRSRRRRPRIV
jgi:hypothetical protein